MCRAAVLTVQGLPRHVRSSGAFTIRGSSGRPQRTLSTAIPCVGGAPRLGRLDNGGMDKHEARRILARRIAELRTESYERLKSHWLHQPDCEQITAESGAEYQVEIEALWDDESAGHLRLVASIDDGGWRALMPITEGFIVAAPDGSFIGE